MLDISFDLDCDNLDDDDEDFLLAAAEHTNAPPVGLQDSETILKPVKKKKTKFEELLKNYHSFMLHVSRTETKIHGSRNQGISTVWTGQNNANSLTYCVANTARFL